MSIEQKIAELLAESKAAKLAEQISEEKVKPDGTETGAKDVTANAGAGDQTNPSKGDAVTVPAIEQNPDNARNNVDTQKQAEAAPSAGAANPKNGDRTEVRKGNAVKEDMDALFHGEELSEEFKDKATTIYEAAVMARVKEEVARLEEEFESKLLEATEKNVEGLVEQVDGYLGYIAEQWIANNEIALERGMKSEILEGFVSGLKGLFEEHYIEVPEERFDVLAEMEDKVAELEAKLNEQVATNVELSKTLAEQKRSDIVKMIGEGLSATESEKFLGLVEELSFESEETFTSKVKTIRENYFTTKPTAEVSSVVTDTPVESLTEEAVKTVDPTMAKYLQALNKR
jgi:hypothetical protein